MSHISASRWSSLAAITALLEGNLSPTSLNMSLLHMETKYLKLQVVIWMYQLAIGLSRIRNFSNRFESYKNLDFRIISIRLLDIDYFHKFYIKLTISNASKYMKTNNFSACIGIQRKVQFLFFYETVKQYKWKYNYMFIKNSLNKLHLYSTDWSG